MVLNPIWHTGILEIPGRYNNQNNKYYLYNGKYAIDTHTIFPGCQNVTTWEELFMTLSENYRIDEGENKQWKRLMRMCVWKLNPPDFKRKMKLHCSISRSFGFQVYIPHDIWQLHDMYNDCWMLEERLRLYSMRW